MEKLAYRICTYERLNNEIVRLEIEAPELCETATPGQFAMLYCEDGGRLLPRPISICDCDRMRGTVCFVFRIAGQGTAEFAGRKVGDLLTCMGPLGNGYDLQNLHKVCLLGGGIGIPPMLYLAKCLSPACEVEVVLGYRDRDTFLSEAFQPYAKVYIATEDGSIGTKGNVLDVCRAFAQITDTTDCICACGPTPMLRAVKAYATQKGIKAQLSLEERMACGIGACLACVCKSVDTDAHSQVKNKRVCKEGPVFFADEIVL